MPLDPQVKAYLDRMAALQLPSFHEMPLAESRSLFRTLRSMVGRADRLGPVEDRTLAGSVPIPSRIYRPPGVAEGPRPALVFYHGGGWVIGGVETVDDLCRKLAAGSGCVVISVGYRLAPRAQVPDPARRLLRGRRPGRGRRRGPGPRPVADRRRRRQRGREPRGLGRP